MKLDDQQLAQFRAFYDIYLAQEADLRSRHLDPLQLLSEAIFAQGSIPEHVELAEETSRVMTVDAPRAVDRYEQAEEHLFNSLVIILREDQRLWFNMVRHERDRACWTAFPGRYPGAHIDLTILLDTLEVDEYDMTATDPELFASLVLSYDSTLNLLARRRGERLTDTMARGVVLQAYQINGVIAKPEGTLEQQELRKKLLAVEQRIHDINVQAIKNLGTLLPEATTAELLQRFRCLAYRPVYPDPTDIDTTLAIALDIEGLTDDERAGIEAIIQERSRRRDAICTQMVERYCEWRAYVSVRWGRPQPELEAYLAQMQHLHLQRVGLVEEVMRSIQEILGPTRSEAFDEARHRIATYELRADV